jgi:N-formylglutamate amidohydrolase
MDKANAELPQRQRADRRVSKYWAPFAQNLSRVLARLEEDQFLILSPKNGIAMCSSLAKGLGVLGSRLSAITSSRVATD